MAVDTKLEQELKNHITLLENLRDQVIEAIGDANGKLKEVQDGKSREEMFPRTE
jgi:hypothetical protein